MFKFILPSLVLSHSICYCFLFHDICSFDCAIFLDYREREMYCLALNRDATSLRCVAKQAANEEMDRCDSNVAVCWVSAVLCDTHLPFKQYTYEENGDFRRI